MKTNNSIYKPSNTRVQNPLHSQVHDLIEQGELSKAMSILCDNSLPAIPSDLVFNSLLSKHPEKLFPQDDDNELLNKIIDFQLTDEDKTSLAVPKDYLKKTIMKLKKSTRPGIDNKHDGNEASTILDYLAHIVTAINIGNIPQDISDFLSTNEIIALRKPNNDVRPIGIGLTLRKLSASWILRTTYKKNSTFFRGLQYGLKPCGMEEIIHALAIKLEKFPSLDLFNIDAENAFNSANRFGAMEQILSQFPQAFPYIQQMYFTSSHAWYHGLTDCIKEITFLAGFHQGDVLGTWLYITSIQPLLKSLQQIIINFHSELETNISNPTQHPRPSTSIGSDHPFPTESTSVAADYETFYNSQNGINEILHEPTSSDSIRFNTPFPSALIPPTTSPNEQLLLQETHIKFFVDDG
jgi:hypothetical protein